jgi:hypothetical protein|nr:MAG TPA: hypothetical protein [Caudoviricetes sp.]
MLYFNYVANIIKFGICWDDGHVGICGGYAEHVVGGEGYAGICVICGTDHLPEIGPAGLPFLDQPPQSTKDGKQER